MPFKRHKVPKIAKKITDKVVIKADDTKKKQPTNDTHANAKELLESAKNVELFENVLNQINAYYDYKFQQSQEVLPIFVGVTPEGLLVELSAVRDSSSAGQPVSGNDLNVFTYQIGTELIDEDIKPRELAEVNMVKGQEQVRLHSEEFPMPAASDGKALAKWRFTEAETIQLETMGIYEVQPENYDQISFGHGILELGGTKEPILPLQNFKAELK
jgi:hypothetical protein